MARRHRPTHLDGWRSGQRETSGQHHEQHLAVDPPWVFLQDEDPPTGGKAKPEALQGQAKADASSTQQTRLQASKEDNGENTQKACEKQA